jgi:hypothetical protein
MHGVASATAFFTITESRRGRKNKRTERNALEGN